MWQVSWNGAAATQVGSDTKCDMPANININRAIGRCRGVPTAAADQSNLICTRRNASGVMATV
jgi:hypothetical protein